MEINLLPISQVAKLARTDKIHLAYLTKLRLIPQTIRRKVDGKITGCYPLEVVDKVQKIEVLKNKGLSYPQIKWELEQPKPAFNFNWNVSPLVFLFIGLILGYLLSGGNKSSAVPTVTAGTDLPKEIYLLTIPDQNLYKIGKINLKDLKNVQP